MLMLEDLKCQDELLSKLENIFEGKKYSHLVSNHNQGDCKEVYLNKEDVILCRKNFSNSRIALAGIDHSSLVKPFFAIDYDHNQRAYKVVEYLTFSNEFSRKLSHSDIESDLTMLAIALSLNFPEVTEISFPPITNEFSNSECSFRRLDNINRLVLKSK